MIDLTPIDIRKKKGDFRRAMRGYDPAMVDDFLDLVADRLESVVREHRAMSDEMARMREQVADFREREKALTEALVSAQEMRDEVKRQAQRDADLVIREAESEAERIMREAESDAEAIRAGAADEVEREEDSIRRIRARRSQLLRSFRSFLERELREVEMLEDSVVREEESGEEEATQAQARGKRFASRRPATEQTADTAEPEPDAGAARAPRRQRARRQDPLETLHKPAAEPPPLKLPEPPARPAASAGAAGFAVGAGFEESFEFDVPEETPADAGELPEPALDSAEPTEQEPPAPEPQVGGFESFGADLARELKSDYETDFDVDFEFLSAPAPEQQQPSAARNEPAKDATAKPKPAEKPAGAKPEPPAAETDEKDDFTWLSSLLKEEP